MERATNIRNAQENPPPSSLQLDKITYTSLHSQFSPILYGEGLRTHRRYLRSTLPNISIFLLAAKVREKPAPVF